MRRIRLIPEYGAHPIWEWVEDGTEDVDPAELPVSPDLRTALMAWDAEFQETFDKADPGASTFQSTAAEEDFERRGRALWWRLSEELRGVADVSYYSVTEGRMVDSGQ